MSIIASQRHLFDIPDDIAYFNCAYYSPQLNEARRRLAAGVGMKSSPWTRTPADFFEDAETIRLLSAKTFGGDADGYAIIPSSSYGMSTAARAIEPDLLPGERVLVIAEEFPSTILPWKRTVEESGATMETVPTPGNGNWTRAILERINKKVRVVAVSSCHWTNGVAIDLRAVGKACRDVGSLLVVDATQSFGAVPFSFEEVQPDFLVASGYKWLLCPYGFTLFYAAEQWRGARPLEEAWQAREKSEDFSALVTNSEAYKPGARRFDMGEKCTPTILPGVIAALEQIGAWGVGNIATTLSTITARITARLEALGYQLYDKEFRLPHMFGANLPAGKRGDVVSELRNKNIYISQRGNGLRIAPHLHITSRDEEHFLDAMEELSK